MAQNLGTSTRKKAHTIYKNAAGKRVPGVTTFLGVVDKPALLYWAWNEGREGRDFRATSSEAADIGKLAHEMITEKLAGREATTWEYADDIVSQAETSALKFWDWLGDKEYEVRFVEEALISELLQCGGTCDIYWKIDGLWTLDDLKTGKAIYPEYKTQASVYADIIRENGYPVDRVRIVNIPRSEEEGFDCQEAYPDSWDNHREFFQACQVIYNKKKVLK